MNGINKRKLELFMDDQLWRQNITHQQSKGVHRDVLRIVCDPEYKARLLGMIWDGNYKIAPPYVVEIPKDNGKVREVYVNQPIDRFVMTQINYVYMQLYGHMIHPRCVSYQKGIGVKNIVDDICMELKKHQGAVGYKVDISKYFDSVSRKVLNEMIDKIDTGSPIDQIVRDYYMDDCIIDQKGNVIEKYKSMTQGCAVSTFFANCVLRDVDEKLSKMDIIYYRYSDDILMVGKDADKALKMLGEMLEAKGLTLNPKKVETVSTDQWFTFLGVRINGQKRSFSEKSLKEFQKHIREYVNKKAGIGSVKVAIRQINKYLYLNFLRNPNEFGWAEYFFSIVNVEDDIKTLDMWIKDTLRGLYTGKRGKEQIGGLGVNKVTNECGVLRGKGNRVSSNLRKTRSDKDILEEAGYISMNEMYHQFRYSKELYRASLTALS